jgi:hypothetical protein
VTQINTAVEPKSAFDALARPVDFTTFLSKLATKQRSNAEFNARRGETETTGHRADAWRRLACALMTLAQHATKMNGRDSVEYYIPDGKYRMQVFAIEDLRDGVIQIYCGNVLDEAIKAKILSKHKAGAAANTYEIAGTPHTLVIEMLDGTTRNPGIHFKNMLGWNRKALRISLPADGNDTQITAVEHICAMSAEKWFNQLPK